MAKGFIWNGSDHQVQVNLFKDAGGTYTFFDYNSGAPIAKVDKMQADIITNAAGTGAPNLPYGQTSINDQPLSYDFSSDADVTFTNTQNRYETVYLSDSGSVLTGTTIVNLDTVPFAKKMVANGTAQTITVQVVGGAGAGVDIPAGTSALLESDGADVIEYHEFLDEGLLLAPDTGFSSTGSRVYPDGTIRGQCSDGSWYKTDPNGYTIANLKTAPTSKAPNSGPTNISFTYPVKFNDVPEITGNVGGNFSTTNGNAEFILMTDTQSTVPSVTSSRVAIVGCGASATATNVQAVITMKGFRS